MADLTFQQPVIRYTQGFGAPPMFLDVASPQSYLDVRGAQSGLWRPDWLNQNYAVSGAGGTGPANTSTPSGVAPQFTTRFVFDTIGQTIYRSIGHVRLPLRFIWVKGIDQSNQTLTSATMTFAAAICAPFDPLEEGFFSAIYDASDLVFSATGGITPPPSWSIEDQAQLIAALAQVRIYPGTEAQQPDPLIVEDKGAAVANAFRGLRYIVVPDYPLANGIPQLSAVWQRTNQPVANVTAVEFPSGVI